MKFCTIKKISTQQCYNNEYEVASVHKNFDLALKAAEKEDLSVIEINDDIKLGDSVNDEGKRWESI